MGFGLVGVRGGGEVYRVSRVGGLWFGGLGSVGLG